MHRSGIAVSYGNSIFSFFQEPPYGSPVLNHCAMLSLSITENIFWMNGQMNKYLILLSINSTGILCILWLTCLHTHTNTHQFVRRSVGGGSSQVALVVKNPPSNAGDLRHGGSTPGSGRSLEKGMATHSSILAWRIPWTQEPGRLATQGDKESDTTEAT